MTNAVPIPIEDTPLLQRAAAWGGPASGLASLNGESLARLAQGEGLEFATAVLYDRLVKDPGHAAFLRQTCSGTTGAARLPELVGIVPGAFYREHRNTGAGGTRVLAIARALGCQAELIPVGSFRTLDENAAVIRNWLASHAGRRVGLVSLSKGGADVKHALGSPDAAVAFATVAAWINFSGILGGTPLVEWLRHRPLRWWGVRLLLWWRRHPVAALEELARDSQAAPAAWPALPPQLRICHVYGVPLRRHLAHPWAGRAYQRLAALGPNDGGGILLGDLCQLPGVVCPVWGADHYLAPAWDLEPFLQNVVRSALAAGPAFFQASQSAAPPSTPPEARSTA